MNYLEPWYSVESGNNLLTELKNELTTNHSLYGLNLEVIAKRGDCDDILIRILDDCSKVAVVHLTWTKENRDNFPKTEIYENLNDWEENRMIPDHEMWI